MPLQEGGGPRPPYHESFLENIIAVNWGAPTGGIFVSGDFCCYQRYTRLEDNKSANFKWIGLGSMAFTDGGGTVSGSYAKTAGGPVFLLGGHRGGVGGGVLMRSTDGYSWTAMQAGPLMGDDISALVWDKQEKRFYLDPGGGQRPYYSADGIYWFYSGTHFEDHCKNPLGAPDGVYGYDKKNDVVIYPYNNEAVAIVNASTMDAEEFTIWVGLDFVYAINFTGGIWMAGGGAGGDSATTTSLDGGNFWFYSTTGSLNMTGDYDITVMLGAPIKDFRNTKSTAPSTKGREEQTETVVRPPSTLLGATHGRQSVRPGLGVMAAAISPPRRPRLRLPHYNW
jgi:hypothetical protein